MMDSQSGTFVPLPDQIGKQLDEIAVQLGMGKADRDDLERQRQHILDRLPKPTLHIGEIVEIKGVKFLVTRIKLDGKLGLKMVADK